VGIKAKALYSSERFASILRGNGTKMAHKKEGCLMLEWSGKGASVPDRAQCIKREFQKEREGVS